MFLWNCGKLQKNSLIKWWLLKHKSIMPYNQHLNVNVKKRDYKSREMTSCQSIFRSKEAEEKFKEYKFHSLASLNKTGKQGFEAGPSFIAS